MESMDNKIWQYPIWKSSARYRKFTFMCDVVDITQVTTGSFLFCIMIIIPVSKNHKNGTELFPQLVKIKVATLM